MNGEHPTTQGPLPSNQHVCPACRNRFVQPFVCMTCGAQKLYDETVLSQAATIEGLRVALESLKQYRNARGEYVATIGMCEYIDKILAGSPVETSAKPVAWRRYIDDAVIPRWIYTAQEPVIAPEKWEPLYAGSAPETTQRRCHFMAFHRAEFQCTKPAGHEGPHSCGTAPETMPAQPEKATCGCVETYPQLTPGHISHGSGCKLQDTQRSPLHDASSDMAWFEFPKAWASYLQAVILGALGDFEENGDCRYHLNELAKQLARFGLNGRADDGR